MKLQNELATIESIFTGHSQEIRNYIPVLKTQGNFKGFETRLTWDCLHAFVGSHVICSWYDIYNCNDNHITTVAKRALRNLNII